jgi:hypothetical protein
MTTFSVRRGIMLLAVLFGLAAGGLQAQDDTAMPQDASPGKDTGPRGDADYKYGQHPGASKLSPRGSLPPNPTVEESVGTPTKSPERSESSGSGAITGSDKGASSGAGNGAGNAKQRGTAIMFLGIPIATADQNQAIKQGCWARFHDRENFTGGSLTLVGPVQLADMGGPFGLNWDDRIKSMETGANTRVAVYDDEEFEHKVAEFKPGQRIADISKRMGFFDEFGSLKIDCQ